MPRDIDGVPAVVQVEGLRHQRCALVDVGNTLKRQLLLFFTLPSIRPQAQIPSSYYLLPAASIGYLVHFEEQLSERQG